MKPRLIKFSCPFCGTRLAVPRHLAGVEDHCPKCGNKVASPVPVDEPAPPVEIAPPVVVEPELPTTAPVIEPPVVETHEIPLVQEPPVAEPMVADLPLESVHDEPPLVEQEPEAELFEAELPANVEATLADEVEPEEPESLEPPAPEQPPVPEKLPVPEHGPRPPLPAHVGEKGTSLLESILRPSHQPLTAALRPSVTEVTPKPLPGAHSPAPFPLRPIADDPQRLEIEDPGMGEILEDHFTQTGVSGITRHRAPGLGIDLMQVEDSDQSERRNRRGRIALRGVIVFIIVDLCLVGWFGWARVKKWWTYEPQVIHKAVPVPDPPSEARNEGPTGAEADKEQKPMPGTTPAAPLPKPEPPAIPPVSDLLPSASQKTTVLTLPQIQPGSKTNEATGSDPAPSPAPLSSPSADTAKAEAPISKSVDALPADVPRTPPVPPPPPDVIHREKPPEPMKEVSESAAVIKAIPLPVDPTANPGTPSTAPADQPDKKEQESHSDRAVAAMVAKIGASFNPLESNTMPLTNTPIPEAAEDTVPADAVSAQKAAKAFLAASSWSERLKWSQRPETIKSAMEKHYASHPDGPVAFTAIEFMQRFPAKSGLPAYCMFEVRGPKLPHPVLLLVDQPAKKDAQVDWEAFVEFQNDTLNRFFAARTTEARRFRVVVRRRHAFEKGVPDLDNKDSFEVSHPGAGETFPVYVSRKSETGKDLANKLPWNNDLPAIVELLWHKQGSQEWVELRSLVANGWKL